MRPPNALLALLCTAMPAVSFASPELSSTHSLACAEETAFFGDEVRIRTVELPSRAPVGGIELGATLRARPIPRGLSHALFPGDLDLHLDLHPRTGEATIARAELRTALRKSGGKGSLEIRPRGFFGEENVLRLAIDPWPTETAELELPPWGWVRFEAEDADGQRIAADAELMVNPGRLQPLWSQPLRPKLRQGLSERIPCALGVAFEVDGKCADGSELAARGARGPATRGAEVVIPVRPKPRAEPFRARVGLATGEPLRNAFVEVAFEISTPMGAASTTMDFSKHRLTTDEQGWVFVPDADPAEHRPRLLQFHFTHQHPTRGLLSARLESTIHGLTTSHELGEVQLEAPSLLCAGVVVDHLGRPIAGARLSAALELPNEVQLLTSEPIAGSTDAEGRFVLMRTLAAPSALLDVQCEGSLPIEQMRIDAGARDLILVVQPAARLRGSVVLPAGMTPRKVQVYLLDPAGTGDESSTRPGADGSFAFDHLAPGVRTVSFIVHDTGVSMKVPDVRLVAGEECLDPRVQQVSLCEGWRQIHLRVLEGSTPVEAASWFWISSSPGEKGSVLRANASGVGSAWVPPMVEHFEIRGRRHRPSAVSWEPTLQDLRMQRGIRVSLPLETPAFEAFVKLELDLLGDKEWHTAYAEIAHGIAELMIQEPGRYRLVARAVFRHQGDVWTAELELDPEQREIEIREANALRLPALRVREEQLRAAFERK